MHTSNPIELIGFFTVYTAQGGVNYQKEKLFVLLKLPESEPESVLMEANLSQKSPPFPPSSVTLSFDTDHNPLLGCVCFEFPFTIDVDINLMQCSGK
ncbi:hypothetical protein VNO80_10623 [Phaseolus coccineus]|uniref:Uncharacterized protein n=1 Tax=Phaseolus coccineus TaxID=3886 RepID=A0AAN9N8I0_PHACN